MLDKIKRKDFYTDSQLQFKFISIIVALFTIEASAFAGITYMIILNVLRGTFNVEDKLVFVYFSVLVMLIVLAFINAYVGMRLSHKVAGPLYCFTKSVRSISQGDISKLVLLRDNDLLQDFEADFNNMINSIQNAVKEDKARKTEVISSVQQIREEIERTYPNREENNKIYNSLESISENTSKMGSFFNSSM